MDFISAVYFLAKDVKNKVAHPNYRLENQGNRGNQEKGYLHIDSGKSGIILNSDNEYKVITSEDVLRTDWQLEKEEEKKEVFSFLKIKVGQSFRREDETIQHKFCLRISYKKERLTNTEQEVNCINLYDGSVVYLTDSEPVTLVDDPSE